MKTTIIAQDRKHLFQLIRECIDKEGNECDLNHINTSLITNMNELFDNSKFNGNVSKWNTANVIAMDAMFLNCAFNGDISKWNTGNVMSMQDMFAHSEFNGDISKWNTVKVINMRYIFAHSKFKQNVSEWNVSNVLFTGSSFIDCPAPVPYWAKIEDLEELRKAVSEYQKIIENKKQLEATISKMSLVDSRKIVKI